MLITRKNDEWLCTGLRREWGNTDGCTTSRTASRTPASTRWTPRSRGPRQPAPRPALTPPGRSTTTAGWWVLLYISYKREEWNTYSVRAPSDLGPTPLYQESACYTGRRKSKKGKLDGHSGCVSWHSVGGTGEKFRRRANSCGSGSSPDPGFRWPKTEEKKYSWKYSFIFFDQKL